MSEPSRPALLCRLFAYLPDAGFAADPIGVLGVVGSVVAVELVPGEVSEAWARRLRDAGSLDPNAMRSWEREANGVSWAVSVTEIDLDRSPEQLRDLVSGAFEELLVERALMREELP